MSPAGSACCHAAHACFRGAMRCESHTNRIHSRLIRCSGLAWVSPSFPTDTGRLDMRRPRRPASMAVRQASVATEHCVSRPGNCAENLNQPCLDNAGPEPGSGRSHGYITFKELPCFALLCFALLLPHAPSSLPPSGHPVFLHTPSTSRPPCTLGTGPGPDFWVLPPVILDPSLPMHGWGRSMQKQKRKTPGGASSRCWSCWTPTQVLPLYQEFP